MTGGLASPPESQNTSPLVPVALSSDLSLEKLPPPHFANARHGSRETHKLAEEHVHHPDNMVPISNSRPTSRRSSLQSTLTDIWEMDCDDLPSAIDSEKRSKVSTLSQPEKEVHRTILVKSRKTLSDSLDEGMPMVGVESSQLSSDSEKEAEDDQTNKADDWSFNSSDSEKDRDLDDTNTAKLFSQPEKEVHRTIVVKSRKTRSVPLNDDKGDQMIGVKSSQLSSVSEKDAEDDWTNDFDNLSPNSSNSEDDRNSDDAKPAKTTTIAQKSKQISVDSDLADQLATFGIRKSCRNKPNPNVVTPLDVVRGPNSSNGKRKSALKKDKIFILVSFLE